jgi:hypothetical protein
MRPQVEEQRPAAHKGLAVSREVPRQQRRHLAKQPPLAARPLQKRSGSGLRAYRRGAAESLTRHGRIVRPSSLTLNARRARRGAHPLPRACRQGLSGAGGWRRGPCPQPRHLFCSPFLSGKGPGDRCHSSPGPPPGHLVCGWPRGRARRGIPSPAPCLQASAFTRRGLAMSSPASSTRACFAPLSFQERAEEQRALAWPARQAAHAPVLLPFPFRKGAGG